MKRHRAHLFLVKGLHEIGHILTPIFMKHMGLYINKKDLTLIKIGTMTKSRKVNKDAGYILEELLSGGRMFHNKSTNGTGFSIGSLMLQKSTSTPVKPNNLTMYDINDSFLQFCL